MNACFVPKVKRMKAMKLMKLMMKLMKLMKLMKPKLLLLLPLPPDEGDEGDEADADEGDDCEGCGDKRSVCENSAHPCYKCDGGCGKIMGTDNDCQRTCDNCGEGEEGDEGDEEGDGEGDDEGDEGDGRGDEGCDYRCLECREQMPRDADYYLYSICDQCHVSANEGKAAPPAEFLPVHVLSINGDSDSSDGEAKHRDSDSTSDDDQHTIHRHIYWDLSDDDELDEMSISDLRWVIKGAKSRRAGQDAPRNPSSSI